MNRSRFIELLSKKESGEISLAERRELNDFILANNQYDAIIRSLEIFNTESSNFNKKENGETEIELAKLKEKISQTLSPGAKEYRLYRLNYVWYAAACVILLLIGALIYYRYEPKENLSKQSVLTTNKGSKSNIKLPDGTVVWINADTKLTYDESFGQGTREVILSGEAYFDVVKDKNHPFIVHTKTMDIKVVGTAFNVRAYADENNTSTTLVRGAVEVTLKRKNTEKITLSPNEKLVVNNKIITRPAEIKKAEPEFQLLNLKPTADSALVETQWIRNKLAFEQEKLSNIIPVLERWYNVSIELKSSYKDSADLNGTFENDSLADVLQSLKIIAGFNYKIENGRVIIF